MNILYGTTGWQPLRKHDLKPSNIDLIWHSDHSKSIELEHYHIRCEQRYIKPAQHKQPQPFVPNDSPLIIATDSFLIECEALSDKLGVQRDCCDVELVYHAYKKWGHQCVKHLRGNFLVCIWDSNKQELFIATDHNGFRPCYIFQSKRGLQFSNNFQQIVSHISESLTVNKCLFEQIAFDGLIEQNTSYQEITKLPPAHYLIYNRQGTTLHNYWQLSDSKKKHTYKTRQEYYDAFVDIFKQSVKEGLQTNYSILSHISGGLDSSSVTSMAAHCLQRSNKPLHAFTARPNTLTGRSHRAGWQYNEMSLVKDVLKRYPNISHHEYTCNPEDDIFSYLQKLYPILDQPIRNAISLDWGLAAYRYAFDKDARILLKGTGGNGSISWVGSAPLTYPRKVASRIKYFLRQQHLLNAPYMLLKKSFVSDLAKNNKLMQTAPKLNPHLNLLIPPQRWSRYSGAYALQQYHGLAVYDPTTTLPVVEFCLNTPQWVYRRGAPTLDRRLLARESLCDFVPESVRKNPFRGEQAVDWYLQYNHNIAQWRERLYYLPQAAADITWGIYDKEKIFQLIDRHPKINAPTFDIDMSLKYQLMRCMNIGFHCESLITNGFVS